jgi:hypothetical protein
VYSVNNQEGNGHGKIKCNDHKTKEIESFKYLGRKTVKNKQKKICPAAAMQATRGRYLLFKIYLGKETH